MLLNELRDYNASLLQTGMFKDYCPNGVQVEGRAEVRRIATGVTASQQVLDAAIAWGADAVLVKTLTTLGMAFCAAALSPVTGVLPSPVCGAFSYRVTTPPPLRTAPDSNSGFRVLMMNSSASAMVTV